MYDPLNDEQVTAYFLRLSARMGKVSPEWQREQIEELRQHLSGIVASRLETGAAVHQAVADALTALGGAEEIGRRLRQEYHCDLSKISIAPAQHRAALCFGAVTLTHLVTLIPLMNAPASWQSKYLPVWPWYMVAVVIIGSPILAGWLTGRTGLHRVGLGTASVLGTTGILLSSLWLLFSPLREVNNFWRIACESFLWMGLYQLVWMPLGCLSAVLASRIKNRPYVVSPN